MKSGRTLLESRAENKGLRRTFRSRTDELSGHVALRHPQSNENGRYERGEALTENKALSAYFQGRNCRVPRTPCPVRLQFSRGCFAAGGAGRLVRGAEHAGHGAPRPRRRLRRSTL